MPFPYPVDFPSDEANLLLGEVAGQKAPLGDTVHAGWAVAGYATSKIIPVGTNPLISPTPRPPMGLKKGSAEHASACDQLKKACEAHDAAKSDPHRAKGFLDGIDWRQVLSLALSFAQQILTAV